MNWAPQSEFCENLKSLKHILNFGWPQTEKHMETSDTKIIESKIAQLIHLWKLAQVGNDKRKVKCITLQIMTNAKFLNWITVAPTW